MKKLLNTSFVYAIAGLFAGVYYREMTKFLEFKGVTQLSFVHTHLFALGMLFFLIVLVLEKSFSFTATKKYRLFYRLYNSGLILTALMFIIQGTLQVLETPLSSGVNASISGIAGMGHILIASGIVYLFLTLKEKIK
jgi:hypothetical protein